MSTIVRPGGVAEAVVVLRNKQKIWRITKLTFYQQKMNIIGVSSMKTKREKYMILKVKRWILVNLDAQI